MTTVLNLNPLDQPEAPTRRATPAERTRARATVARHATDPHDEAALLRMLGLEGE